MVGAAKGDYLELSALAAFSLTRHRDAI